MPKEDGLAQKGAAVVFRVPLFSPTFALSPVRRSSIGVAALVVVAAIGLAGCQRNPLVVKRSPCPAVAVPAYLGDVTLFRPGGAVDSNNIDIVATITNVRETCLEGDVTLTTDISFDVVARRNDAGPARTLTLPVFASIVQGGNLVLSKQIVPVQIAFAQGQTRATGSGGVRTNVNRAQTQLTPELYAKINRKRKATDPDAAVDPLADPEVRAALRAASFEALIGFQLDEAGLAYNVTK